MASPKKSITTRQLHWLDHIKAAEASADTPVAYAAAHHFNDGQSLCGLAVVIEMQGCR